MKKLRIAVLISGGGSNLQSLIDHCAMDNFPAEIACVISNKPHAYGLIRAKEAGLPCFCVEHQHYAMRESFDEQLTKILEQCKVQLVCLAGFMRLLSPGFVNHWHDRLINIHPSLLPDFKGLNAQQQALEAGVKMAGCTVHFVRPEMDAGPIIAQGVVGVSPSDDVQSLSAKILKLEHQIYPAVIKLLATGN